MDIKIQLQGWSLTKGVIHCRGQGAEFKKKEGIFGDFSKDYNGLEGVKSFYIRSVE
jgi:hypothetical protein